MDDLSLALRIRAAVEGQDAIVRLGTSFVDTNKKIETLIRGLTAITGSTEGAAKEFEYLAESSKKYGISILDMSDNYVKFIAASKETNLEGEAAKKIFESVSSAMAVLGGDTITTHRAFNALSQMMSKTQIYAEELKGQLAEAIPGSLQLMAKALNITTSEMLELMKAGQLSADALLPFAYELDKQYGKLATSSTTFVQATNQIQTAWALLMKRLGDTGVWSVLTSTLDKLGNHSEVLAGFIGVGLAAAFSKIASGVYSAIGAMREYIAVGTLQATSAERSAAANLLKAESDAASALATSDNAIATANLARLELAAAVGANQIAAAKLKSAAASTAEVIANNELVASLAAVELAQKRLVSTQGLFAKGLALLSSPGGILLAVVASFAAMAFAFKEQDDATKNLSKSTEEYTAALESMAAAQVANQNEAAKNQIDDTKGKIETLQKEIELIDEQGSRLSQLTNGWVGFTNVLKFWQSDSEQRNNTNLELIKSQEELTVLEGKRQIGLDSLSKKYLELMKSEESLQSTNSSLLNDQEKQQQIVNSLNDVWFKSSDQVKQLAKEQEKLNEINKTLVTSSANLKTANDLTTKALAAYAEQTGLTTEEVKKAIAGDTDFISSLDKKKQATVNAIQRQRELSALERESQVQLRLLKAEYDNIEGSVKAQTEAKIKEATVLGDLEKKRAAEIDQGRQLIQLAELGIKTSKEEINNISLQIAQKQEEAKTNDKERVNIENNIAKLEEQRLGLQKTLNQREANIAAVRAEAIATEIANSLISDSFTKNQQIIANAANEIARLRQEYNELNQTSAGTELLKSQEETTQRIIEQQNKASDAAKVMGESMRSVYATLGIDWKEVITGMDFDTQRMIDAFGLLGESGLTTAQQIQTSFEGVLSKANTETEINAIRVQLQKLKDDGVISFEQLGLMTVDVQKKLTDLKVSIDPVQQAFARLGLGVPEQLTQVAEGLRVSFNLLKSINAPIESVQQAFLNMAQAQITASLATGQAIPATLQLEAASLGLSSAFQELVRSLQASNQEFNAVIAQYERLQQIQDKNNELKQKEIELGDEWNTVTLKRSQNLGDEAEILASLVKADQLRVEAIQQEIAISEKKVLAHTLEIKQLEAIEAAGRKLSEEDKNKLELMKLQLALDQQLVLSGKAKQAQIESEIVSYQNSINKIQERLKQYLLEASLRNEANASQQKTIEIEKQLELSKGNLTAAREKDLGIAKEELDIAKEKFQEDAKKLNAVNDEIKRLEDEYNATGRNNQELLKSIETLKLRRAAEIAGTQASEADIQVKERQVELARIAAGQVGKLIELYNEQAKAHQRAADSSERYQEQQVQEAENELKLAQIKGNAADIDKAQAKVNDQKITQAEAIARQRAIEANDSENAVSAKVIEMAVDGQWTKADQDVEDQMRATSAARRDAAQAAQENANQLRDEADAAKEAADANKKLAEAEAEAKESAAQLAAAGDAVNSNFSAANKVLVETGGNLEELNKAFIALQESSNRTAIGWDAWARNTANAADTVVQSFHDQKNAVDDAVAALDAFAQTGQFTSQTQQALNLSTRDTKTAFNLLNDSDLSKLESSIESAKNRMDDLRQSSEEALAAAQQSLLQEQGDTVGVLRLEQKQKELELQKKLNEAKQSGDQIAVRNIQDTIELEKETYRLKLQKAEADKKANEVSTKQNDLVTENTTGLSKQNDLISNQQSIVNEVTQSVEKGKTAWENSAKALEDAKNKLDELNQGTQYNSDLLKANNDLTDQLSQLQTEYGKDVKKTNEGLSSDLLSIQDGYKKDTLKADQSLKEELISAQKSYEKSIRDSNKELNQNLKDDQDTLNKNLIKNKKDLANDLAKADETYGKSVIKNEKSLSDDLSKLQVSYSNDIAKLNTSLSDDMEKTQVSYTKSLENLNQNLADTLTKSQESYSSGAEKINQSLTENLSKAQDSYSKSVSKINQSLETDLAKAQDTYSESLLNSKEKLNEQLSALDSELAKSITKANSDSESKIQDLITKTSEKIVEANTKRSESIAELSNSDSQKIQESLAKTADSIQSEVSSHNKAMVDLEKGAADSIAQVTADAAQKISELNKKSKEESKTALESLKETALGISKQLSGNKNDAGSIESDAFQKDTQKITELYAKAGKEGKAVYDKAIKDSEKLHRQNIEQLVKEGKLTEQEKQSALTNINQQIESNKELLKVEIAKVAAQKAEQQTLIDSESAAKILSIQQETDKKIADAKVVSNDKIANLQEESNKALANIQIEHQAKLDAIEKEHAKTVANAESDKSKSLLENSKALADEIEQLKIKQRESIATEEIKNQKEIEAAKKKNADDIAAAQKKNADDLISERAKLDEDIANAKKKSIDDIASLQEKTNEEIASAKKKNAEDIVNLQEKNNEDILALKKKNDEDIVNAKAKNDEGIADAKKKNDEDILAAKVKLAEDIADAKKKNDEEIANSRSKYSEDIANSRKKNEEAIANAKLKSDEDIVNAKAKNEAAVAASKVKLEEEIVDAKKKNDAEIANLRVKNDEAILAEKEKTAKQILLIKEKNDAEIKALQEVVASATLSYTEQNNRLLELNATLKNQLTILTAIKQVAATTESAKSSSTSSSSSVSSSRNQTEGSKGVYNVNFTIGGKTLNTQWNTDPSEFITVLERAQKTGL